MPLHCLAQSIFDFSMPTFHFVELLLTRWTKFRVTDDQALWLLQAAPVKIVTVGVQAILRSFLLASFLQVVQPCFRQGQKLRNLDRSIPLTIPTRTILGVRMAGVTLNGVMVFEVVEHMFNETAMHARAQASNRVAKANRAHVQLRNLHRHVPLTLPGTMAGVLMNGMMTGVLLDGMEVGIKLMTFRKLIFTWKFWSLCNEQSEKETKILSHGQW